MAVRSILLSVLAALLSNAVVRADDTPRLTGSTLKASNIPGGYDAAFIGKITKMGIKSPVGANAGPIYQCIKIEVIRVLRGSIDGTQTSVTLFTNLEDHEKLPKIRVEYIFFVSINDKTEADNPDPFYVRKLLPATDENVARVKKMIPN